MPAFNATYLLSGIEVLVPNTKGELPNATPLNRRQLLARASAVSAGAAVAPFTTDVQTFGAKGDGIADDRAAIQAALDHVGTKGGGVVRLAPPKVHYRITGGLKLPSNVILEGPAPVHYPFSAGNPGACALVANFSDIRQWMIEPKTTERGQTFTHDHLVAGSLPDGVTYNCGVRNLLLTSSGKVPYGGIRMHGCPGSIVEGVSIDRVGCGLLVNYSFGGSYKVQVHSLYYGVAAWDDANANLFEIYCTHSTPWPKTVPADYRMPFMAQMADHFADTLMLADNDHAARPYGLLCGSIQSTSINSVFDLVIEQFPGGIFLFNAYATDFRRCYIEASSGRMATAVTASRSRFGIQALHALLSGTGMTFDFGINVLARIFASGIVDTACFGKPPLDDGASLLILEGMEPTLRGAPIQRNIRYLGRDPAWTPLALTSGWQPAADDFDTPAVRLDPWSYQVELKGTIIAGRNGVCFQLPETCRPARRRRYMAAGGQLSIGPDGVARIADSAGTVSLDGITFGRW